MYVLVCVSVNECVSVSVWVGVYEAGQSSLLMSAMNLDLDSGAGNAAVNETKCK